MQESIYKESLRAGGKNIFFWCTRNKNRW